MPAVPGVSIHHVALTVTDLGASVLWYEQLFGITYRMDTPHAGGVGKILADESWQLMLTLHRHDTAIGDTFSETRTGLDHVGFKVPSRADLQTWQHHLGDNGVQRSAAADRPLTQSPIFDEPYGSVLVFRDPDNIQLELFPPPSPAQRTRSNATAVCRCEPGSGNQVGQPTFRSTIPIGPMTIMEADALKLTRWSPDCGSAIETADTRAHRVRLAVCGRAVTPDSVRRRRRWQGGHPWMRG